MESVSNFHDLDRSGSLWPESFQFRINKEILLLSSFGSVVHEKCMNQLNEFEQSLESISVEHSPQTYNIAIFYILSSNTYTKTGFCICIHKKRIRFANFI